MMVAKWALLALCVVGCRAASAVPAAATLPAALPATQAVRSLILVGTSDLHGRLDALPALGGYVRILRELAAREHAQLVLVDAGDMFQGTLESNLVEGESVAKAYAALGYAAVAVGNHEFDFGPTGSLSSVPMGHEGPEPAADPRGALRSRARAALYPFLLANAARKDAPDGGLPVELTPVRSRALLELGGVRIGFTGVTSADTGATTLAANVRDLTFTPLAAAVQREADALRREGASVVVALAHAGSRCESFTGRLDADTCDPNGEVFGLANALQSRAVDAIVAGHTHFGVAHDVNGIPVVQSFAYGRAFGRIDLTLDAGGHVIAHRIHAPRFLCRDERASAPESCELGDYEGQRVVRDERVLGIARDYAAQTQKRREALVGVSFTAPVVHRYEAESALGNLFAKLLREYTKADVALMNGGGLRADLPAGPLQYGQLFAAMPFDNRVATVTVAAGELRKLLVLNLQGGHGVLSVDGLAVVAHCTNAALVVDLYRVDERGIRRGKALSDQVSLRVAASDFLLGGGDDFGALGAFAGATVSDEVMRDVFEHGLRGQGTVDPRRYYDPNVPHLTYAGARPLRCAR